MEEAANMKQFMLTAHSGCEKTPMNSIVYIKKVLEILPDVMEVDVRLSSDGELVLDHNGNAGHAVSFEKACRAIADSPIMINADLKEKNLEEKVLETAKDCGITSARILFSGCLGDPGTMQSRIGEARVFANPEEFDAGFYGCMDMKEREERFKNVLHAICDCQFRTVNINYRYCTENMMSLCRKMKIGISLWTVDDAKDARRLLESRNADQIVNITTNYPTFYLHSMPE
jgi:glycerophosphoryl diester phosphodiesterase